MVVDLSLRARELATRVPRGLVRLTAVAAALALLAVAALCSRSQLPSPAELRRPDAWWVGVAVSAQLGSLVAYALIVQQLLAERGVTARTHQLMRATVGGIALGASLPGGQALSTAYWYKLLRREGAGRAAAAIALVGSMIAGIVSLACLLLVGVVVAGKAGPCACLRAPILVGVGGALIVRIAFGRHLGRAVRRLPSRFAPVSADDFTMGGRRIVAVAGAAFLNWLLDCATLVASLQAVGAHVPSRGVLLTYSLAQVVAALPLLPGGGGTVELSLSLGFAALGHTAGAVLAGVILYRLISCWGLIPVGWLAFALDGRAAGLRGGTLRQSFR